uniref:BTB domain-containing protein n=1 Tax=Panagrellus redivivus TaxID=6233 RepID=A0A7E4UQF6_PANRE
MTTTVVNKYYKYNLGIQIEFYPDEWNIGRGAALISDGHYSSLLPQLTFGVAVYPFGDNIEPTENKLPCPVVAITAKNPDGPLGFDVKVTLNWGTFADKRNVKKAIYNTAAPLVQRFAPCSKYEEKSLIVTVYLSAKIPWDYGILTEVADVSDDDSPAELPESMSFVADENVNPYVFTVSVENLNKLNSSVIMEHLRSSSNNLPLTLNDCSNATALYVKGCMERGSFEDLNIDMISRLGKEVCLVLMMLECREAMKNLIAATLKALEFPHFYVEVKELLKFAYSNGIPGLMGILVHHFAEKYGDNPARMKDLGKHLARDIEILHVGEEAFKHCTEEPTQIGKPFGQ